MLIDIISVVPDLLLSPFNHSILKRAQERNLLQVRVHNLRNYAINQRGQVDDYVFGGGAGMVLRIEPLVACLEALQAECSYDEVIYFTPDGEVMQQQLMNRLSLGQNYVLICGHYKGVDERFREHFVTKELSIGDYVLSGGELAAAVFVDAIGRLLPGALNDETSALTDSFQDHLLAPPVYTRPEVFRGLCVPDILTSGHKLKIENWRYDQSLMRTQLRRPDLLKKNNDNL